MFCADNEVISDDKDGGTINFNFEKPSRPQSTTSSSTTTTTTTTTTATARPQTVRRTLQPKIRTSNTRRPITTSTPRTFPTTKPTTTTTPFQPSPSFLDDISDSGTYLPSPEKFECGVDLGR